MAVDRAESPVENIEEIPVPDPTPVLIPEPMDCLLSVHEVGQQ